MKISLNKSAWLQGVLLGCFAISCLISCKGPDSDLPDTTPTEATKQYIHLQGKTMGTTYHISYNDPQKRNFKSQIDSLLVALNMEVSTYIPEATISKLNQSKEGLCLQTASAKKKEGAVHFQKIFKSSVNIHDITNGAFNPTIMPLVNFWGFGYKGHEAQESVDYDTIQMILKSIGMDKFKLTEDLKHEDCRYFLSKSSAAAELDFSAIAKGYGVDIVAQLLKEQGIEDFKVEIGGELVCQGKNTRGTAWKIGINTPDPSARLNDFKAIVALDNQAMASSGNYRNFHVIDGKKYGHELSSETGYPAETDLLSVSVIAPNCAEADAYATAFMVMGLEAANALATRLNEIEAYFISSDDKGNYITLSTPGFKTEILPSQ